jgi:putative ABC transport system ATP-binding protein
MPAVIRCVDLTKTYGRPATPVHALRGVSLDIEDGERVALLGRSGSGKSTLLNLLGGLDRPSDGKLQVAGQDLERLSSRQLAQYRLTTVGMIFQSFNLIPSQSALENVALPMIFAGRSRADRLREAEATLDAVGLGPRKGHRPKELSGGEMQRVAIARALMSEAPLLLADEPTGNLDTATAAQVLELLQATIRDSGLTLVLVTHDPGVAARADRHLTILDGRLVSDDRSGAGGPHPSATPGGAANDSPPHRAGA